MCFSEQEIMVLWKETFSWLDMALKPFWKPELMDKTDADRNSHPKNSKNAIKNAKIPVKIP